MADAVKLGKVIKRSYVITETETGWVITEATMPGRITVQAGYDALEEIKRLDGLMTGEASVVSLVEWRPFSRTGRAVVKVLTDTSTFKKRG